MANVGTAATGKILQGAGVGAPPSYSVATYPSVAGTIGNLIASDGTNFISQPPNFPYVTTISQIIDLTQTGTTFLFTTLPKTALGYSYIHYNLTSVNAGGGSTYNLGFTSPDYEDLISGGGTNIVDVGYYFNGGLQPRFGHTIVGAIPPSSDIYINVTSADIGVDPTLTIFLVIQLYYLTIP